MNQNKKQNDLSKRVLPSDDWGATEADAGIEMGTPVVDELTAVPAEVVEQVYERMKDEDVAEVQISASTERKELARQEEEKYSPLAKSDGVSLQSALASATDVHKTTAKIEKAPPVPQKPSLGRIVHVNRRDKLLCGIITKIYDDTTVSLKIYGENYEQHLMRVSYDEKRGDDTWFWPERV